VGRSITGFATVVSPTLPTTSSSPSQTTNTITTLGSPLRRVTPISLISPLLKTPTRVQLCQPTLYVPLGLLARQLACINSYSKPWAGQPAHTEMETSEIISESNKTLAKVGLFHTLQLSPSAPFYRYPSGPHDFATVRNSKRGTGAKYQDGVRMLAGSSRL
jgi:hypothetical protein